MDLSVPGLLSLLRETIRDPSLVARQIMALRLDRGTLWSALALATILSVLLVAVMEALLPVQGATSLIGPWLYTVILGSSLVVSVFILTFVGNALGGGGDLGDALALMAWYQMLLLALQVFQLVSILIAPLLGMVASVISLGIALWVIVNFVNEMHRFGNMGRAVLTLVLAFLGLALGLGLILGSIGVNLPS